MSMPWPINKDRPWESVEHLFTEIFRRLDNIELVRFGEEERAAGGTLPTSVTSMHGGTLTGETSLTGPTTISGALALSGATEIGGSLTLKPEVWPAFGAYASANQSVPGVPVVIAYNTKMYDTNNNFDAVNYRWKPTVAGRYLLMAYWYSNQGPITRHMQTRLRVNGSVLAMTTVQMPTSSHTTGPPPCMGVWYANGTTDYFDAAAFSTQPDQIQGGSGGHNWFFGCRIA